MWQRGDRREDVRRHVLARNQQLLRLQPGREPRLNEVLALDREQTELVPPAPVPKLPNELQPRVGV